MAHFEDWEKALCEAGHRPKRASDFFRDIGHPGNTDTTIAVAFGFNGMGESNGPVCMSCGFHFPFGHPSVWPDYTGQPIPFASVA